MSNRKCAASIAGNSDANAPGVNPATLDEQFVRMPRAVGADLGGDWARMPKGGSHVRGLGRSYLYDLDARGEIRTIALRKPGATKGVRLIYLPSLDAFLARAAAEQEAAAAAKRNTAKGGSDE